MRKNWLGLLVGIATLIFAVGQTRPDEAAFDIQMTRRAKVGDHYLSSRTIDESENTSVVMGGKKMPLEGTKFSTVLAAHITIETVDITGQVTGISAQIESFDQIAGDKRKALLKKGDDLRIDYTERGPSCTLKDGELSEEVREALAKFYPPRRDNEASEDDVFGTKDKQKIGASWPVHPDPFVKDAEVNSIKVDPKDVQGTTTLKEKTNVRGMPCLKLVGAITTKDFASAVPEGMTLHSSELVMHTEGNYPIDTSKPVLDWSVDLTIKLAMSGKQGKDAKKEVDFDVTSQRKETGSITLDSK